MTINSQELLVEKVTEPADQAKGLGGRPHLPENHGMLFDFGQYTMPTFWMKDMQFDLDIIWIKDNTIVGIAKQVPAPASGTADENLPIYAPNESVNKVLEVNAGWTDKNGVKIGNEIVL